MSTPSESGGQTAGGTFLDGGEMGALMRATDWARTPLGPIESWPQTLVGYVRMILDMPTAAIIFWGPEQTQIYNAGYATIMGPRHPRYFGAPYRECWPDTYPTIYPRMRNVLEKGEVVRVENEHIPVTRYGFEEETYFTFTFSPLRDDGGRIAGILQPVFEVTESVLSERRAATLRALDPRRDGHGGIVPALAVIADNAEDIPFALIYLHDPAAGELELVGRTGFPAGCETNFAETAHRAFEVRRPEKIDDVRALVGGAHLGPWPEPTESAWVLPMGRSGTESPSGVVVFGISARLHFDDRYRSFLELVAGQVTAGVTRELERARRQREAGRRRQYLSDLFTQAPAAIAVLRGPQHVFELANPLYQQVVGVQRELLGKPLRAALPELQGQPFYDVLDEVYRSGEPYVGTEELARLDRTGSGVPEDVFFNFVYQPMRDADGAVEGILVFAYDVTTQVRARQRVEALMDELKLEHRRKDEFLAMLAHELRNPLAAVHNAVRLLQGSAAAEPRLRRHLSILARQSRTLSSLVDDLLDVSRITRGLVELRRERLDLTAVVRRALESVQPALDERRHRVRLDLPDAPVPVEGDAVRLEQILVNLLTNAAKFTDPEGAITISLEIHAQHSELRVRDTGIGIPPASLTRIFILFGQVERGLGRGEGGLGIGLTIVKNLVELHGGRIEAASEGAGRGAEFIVSLPLAPPGEISSSAAATPAEPASAPAPKRVLVVDDNADAADTLALLIQAAGHDVAIAYDGPSALAEAARNRPDFVLLDIGLPGIDGYEVAERLRRDLGTRSVKIAALTGYGQQRDRARTEAADFDAHFVKPVELETVLDFLGESAPAP